MYQDASDPPALPPARPAEPPRRGQRRFGLGTLMTLTAAAGIIGGASGTVAASQWLSSDPAPSTVITAQPTNDNSAATTNVASAVYEEVGPSVVQVIVSAQSRGRLVNVGNGSGVVVDEDGLILTNHHVIAGGQSISVLFSTGERREARVLGTDSANDLALLKVDLPAGVPAARLGDSDAVRVGETAIAIGSPFGLNQTVTQGIVSATGRSWQPAGGGVMRDLIQTDAPINPGNSGGPLVNANGEVIGINSMIESPVAGSVGIGFAIPINTAKHLLPELESGAQLQRAWLGISGMDLAQAATGEQGVLVTSVSPGSPAAVGDLRVNDVITALGSQPTGSMAQLIDLMAERRPGDEVGLTVRRDGQELQITVTLQPWPDA